MKHLTRKDLIAEITKITSMIAAHPIDPDIWPNSMSTPVPLSVLNTEGQRGHVTKVYSTENKVIIKVATATDSPNDNLPYISLTHLRQELENAKGDEIIVECAGAYLSASKIVGIGARDGYMAFLIVTQNETY